MKVEWGGYCGLKFPLIDMGLLKRFIEGIDFILLSFFFKIQTPLDLCQIDDRGLALPSFGWLRRRNFYNKMVFPQGGV